VCLNLPLELETLFLGWVVNSRRVWPIAEHFRVLGFHQSLLVMVIFGVFVITFMKDIGDGMVLYCVGFFTDATCVVVVLKKIYGWCCVSRNLMMMLVLRR